MADQKADPGTLNDAEAHPAAFSAMQWLSAVPLIELTAWQEAFASSALAGNRLAEISSETLRRVMKGEKVSDRYLLGLCWTMKNGTFKHLVVRR